MTIVQMWLFMTNRSEPLRQASLLMLLAGVLVAKLLRILPNALYDRLTAGRGRKPRWFSEALAKGKKPDDMAI